MFAFGDKVWPGLAKLVEETGELAQVSGRIMMMRGEGLHWSGADLRNDFVDELADVKAAIKFIEMKALTPEEVDRLGKRTDEKMLKFLAWHREQAPVEALACGCIEPCLCATTGYSATGARASVPIVRRRHSTAEEQERAIAIGRALDAEETQP